MPRVQEFDFSPVAGEIELWPKLKLTPRQEQQWAEFKAAMLWSVPSFSDIWLGMMVDKHCDYAWFTDKIPTAATDDKYLYINPTWFFALTLDEQIFVGCHEVCHAMFGHSGLMWTLYKQDNVTYSDGLVLPFNPEIMNKAMDYVINDQLIVAKIGSFVQGGCHWPGVISGDIGVLDSYRICYKATKRKGGGKPNQDNSQGKPGSDLPGTPWGNPLRPGQGRGKTASKAISERSESEWETTVTAALESARLRGNLPANLARAFAKKLQPKADWRDLYNLACSRKMGNDRYTWDMLNQQFAFRHIGVPGRARFGCELIVIAVDTSGSINQRTLDVFLAETMAFLEEAKPRQVIFVQCDAEIHEWAEIDATEDLYGRELKGGGGSRTEPVFERIYEEQLSPDMVVYLTDLCVSFPKQAPPYPVIWGVVDNAKPEAPFGEIVMVPAQVEA